MQPSRQAGALSCGSLPPSPARSPPRWPCTATASRCTISAIRIMASRAPAGSAGACSIRSEPASRTASCASGCHWDLPTSRRQRCGACRACCGRARSCRSPSARAAAGRSRHPFAPAASRSRAVPRHWPRERERRFCRSGRGAVRTAPTRPGSSPRSRRPAITTWRSRRWRGSSSGLFAVIPSKSNGITARSSLWTP
jgi:hypothetical protein